MVHESDDGGGHPLMTAAPGASTDTHAAAGDAFLLPAVLRGASYALRTLSDNSVPCFLCRPLYGVCTQEGLQYSRC